MPVSVSAGFSIEAGQRQGAKSVNVKLAMSAARGAVEGSSALKSSERSYHDSIGTIHSPGPAMCAQLLEFRRGRAA